MNRTFWLGVVVIVFAGIAGALTGRAAQTARSADAEGVGRSAPGVQVALDPDGCTGCHKRL
jgi:hypothetical protein